MKIFEKPNLSHGWKCPICQKDTESRVVLVGIAGTERERVIQAEQFHLDCIDLVYHKDQGVIGMGLNKFP